MQKKEMKGIEMQSNIIPIDQIRVMSRAVAESQMFGFNNEKQAFAIMLQAQADGIHPMKVIKQYHLINGRPALKATEVLSRFQRSGGKIKWIKTNDEEAEAEFFHEMGGTLTLKWTIKMAERAGLLSKNDSIWKKYPRNMLRMRLITEGINALYPACLDGDLTEDVAYELEKEDIEDAEIESEEPKKDLSKLKFSLSNKLKKLDFSNNDIKEFALKFDLTENAELIEEILHNETKLMEMVKEFENGN